MRVHRIVVVLTALLSWILLGLAACAHTKNPIVVGPDETTMPKDGVVRGRVLLESTAEHVPIFWSEFDVVGPTVDAIFVCERLVSSELTQQTDPATTRKESKCVLGLALGNIPSAWALEDSAEPLIAETLTGLFVGESNERLQRVQVTRRTLTRFSNRNECEQEKQRRLQEMRAVGEMFLANQLAQTKTKMEARCQEAREARSGCISPDKREMEKACGSGKQPKKCSEQKERAFEANRCEITLQTLNRQCETGRAMVETLQARIAGIEVSTAEAAKLNCREGPRF